MSIKALAVMGLSVLALSAGIAQAQSSNFARDRNQPVASRVPAGFEPQGMRLRAFVVSPQLDIGLERHDNIFYEPSNEKADTFLSIAPSLGIRSDWGRHAVNASVAVANKSYAEYDSENVTVSNVQLGGRFDIVGNSYLFGGVGLAQNYEPRYSTSFPADAAEPIKFHTDTFNVGFVAEGNRLRFTGTYNYGKYDYFDVDSNAGGRIDQDFRDYKRAEYTGRADYAISPATSIYAVYVANTRDYVNNPLRDSDGYDMAIGASFDLTNVITGEVQLGYMEQSYDNPAFAKAKGGSYKATVNYFPTMMTTLSLTAGRSIEETPAVGASGYLSSVRTLSVDHELTRTVILSGSLSSIDDDYEGIGRKDKRTVNRLGAKYFVSPRVWIDGGYTYQELKSSGGGGIPSYKDNGLKVSVSLRY